jgi:AcrR family transcriptional regulator
MESAGALFAERHYHEVRMDDIAEKAGVAKGTLYLHFKDKEALYFGLIIDGMTRLAHRIEDALSETQDAEDKIRVFLREAFSFSHGSRYLMELIQRVESSRSRERVESLNRAKEKFHILITNVLRGHPSAWGMSDYDLDLAVRCFGGMLKHILQQLPDPWPDDLHDRMARLFLEGFRGPGLREEPG